MFSLYNQLKAKRARSSGFTIVELLIVIVVIGILATLVIVTFTGIQQRARNSQRETDLKAIQSHVAAFYADKGYYPTMADLNDGTFRSTYMKGLDSEALKDPKGSASTLAATAGATTYGYTASATSGCNNALASDPTGATTTNNGCDSYSLSAKREGGGADIVLTGN
jgi:prepilin-type N-terminal cleavage/methylation domain-containing protein